MSIPEITSCDREVSGGQAGLTVEQLSHRSRYGIRAISPTIFVALMNDVNENYVNARERGEADARVALSKKLETCFVIPGLLVKRSRYNYILFLPVRFCVLRCIYSLHPVANVITTFAASRELRSSLILAANRISMGEKNILGSNHRRAYRTYYYINSIVRESLLRS